MDGQKRSIKKWFTDSGAKDWLKALGSAIVALSNREAKWSAAIAPLKLRAQEELQRGRESFEIQVDLSTFPEADRDDYERITYKAEKEITDALPLRCTNVRHADTEGISVLTFELNNVEFRSE